MSSSRCRAKNPARCRSPRCPGRGGASSTFLSPSLPHRDLLSTEKQASEEFIKDLAPVQREVLFDYTNQSYTDLNRALRERRPLSSEQKHMVRHLDAALSRTSERPPRLLLRSIRPPEGCEDVDQWVKETFPVGRTVTFPAYGSTTVSPVSLVAMLRERPKPPRQFLWGTKEEWEAETNASVARNVVLELVTKEGVSVSALSHMPQETEVLLPRGQSYVVHSVDKYVYETNEHILTGEPQESRSYPATRIRLVDASLLD